MTVSATALAALSQSITQADQAAEGIRRATNPAADPTDQVNLTAEAVKLLTARNSFDAAIGLAKASDKMVKSTIDLVA